MKALWLGAAVIGLLQVPAHAETKYDRKLELAVISIVASRIGDIRGGFPFDVKPSLVMNQDAMPTGSVAMRGTSSAIYPWQDGLAPAVEGRVPQGIF